MPQIKRKLELGDDSQPTKKIKSLSGAVPIVKEAVSTNSDSQGVAFDLQQGAAQKLNATKEKGKEIAEDRGNKGDEVTADRESGDEEAANQASSSKAARKTRIRKLDPPRPYPTVPTSVSATGPRSAHVVGKNHICVTRKTKLGCYLRRCKEAVVKDGHKTLHLNAMGAAIPLLLQLSLSLPPILPFPPEDIHTEVLTGTVDVNDEVIPEDDDEDIEYRTRSKSTIMVKITVGDGVDEGPLTGKGRRKKGSGGAVAQGGRNTGKEKAGQRKQGGPSKPEQIVVRAEDLDDLED
ncbi:hypothetical protein C8Q75DRAFT_713627 [Abortiporus biennis]|nr:hypothetical protein C8Q75DRAFT_713627 [Abortiporus biennis]